MRMVSWLLAPLKYTIVADSRTVAEFVSKTEHISLNRFTVIYIGVDLKAIERAKKEYAEKRNEIRAELGIKPGEFVFLNVSRMVRQKRQELAVEGFRLFNQKHPGCRLLFVGDGSRMNAVREKVRACGLESQILLVGESTNVYRFYTIADAFLLTSQREGFCIVGMEALAFGLPLVSTKVGAVAEYVRDGENGYFISSFTPEAVAEAMERLISADIPRTSQNALVSAQPYGSERTATAYEQLFLRSVGQ